MLFCLVSLNKVYTRKRYASTKMKYERVKTSGSAKANMIQLIPHLPTGCNHQTVTDIRLLPKAKSYTFILRLSCPLIHQQILLWVTKAYTCFFISHASKMHCNCVRYNQHRLIRRLQCLASRKPCMDNILTKSASFVEPFSSKIVHRQKR